MLRLDSAKLESGTALTITNASGAGHIGDNDPVPGATTVVNIRDLAAIGSPDPSGLAYVPHLQTLFLSDSEVNEAPFARPNNLFALGTDGTLKQSFSLWSPTGGASERR